MNADLFTKFLSTKFLRGTLPLAMVFAGGIGSVKAQVDVALQKLGMENIRYVPTSSGGSITAFEDRTFRSSYYGVGKALEAAVNAQKEGDIVMVVTDRNGLVQLRMGIPDELVRGYHNGSVSMRDILCSMEMSTNADREMEMLKGSRNEASGRWKPDLVVYPSVYLENSSLDKLFRYAVAISPAIEMPLWKGAELTAQVIFPIATNQKGELKTIRPGYVTLRQGFDLKRNWKVWGTAGLFNNNRMGGCLEAMYRSRNGRWEAGGKLGATVWSMFDNNGWAITTKPKIDAELYGRVYLPWWNTEITGSVNRFVYGDYGMKGELVRHFGEYTVGIFAMLADKDFNGGFSFAIPLPGKKYNRWNGVRIKPADYFSYRYNMVAWGEYVDNKRGRYYNSDIGSNRSKGFYQPEYIRYFLLKETDRTNEK